MKNIVKYIVVISFIIITNIISVIALNIINSKSYNKETQKKVNLTNIKGSKDVLYSNTYNSVNERVTTLKTKSIIEEGTCGGWTYRKYQDGTLDMWAVGSTTKTNYTTYNSMYGYSLVFTWASCPQPINANYTMQAVYRVGSGFSITAGHADKTTTSFTGYILASASGSQTIDYNLYFHGNWK